MSALLTYGWSDPAFPSRAVRCLGVAEWLDAWVVRRDAGHVLCAWDDPRARIIGWFDQTANEGYCIDLAVAREGRSCGHALVDERFCTLIKTPEGRAELFASPVSPLSLRPDGCPVG